LFLVVIFLLLVSLTRHYALILSFYPLVPATLVAVRPVGIVDLVEGDTTVHILLVVVAKDPRNAEIKDVEGALP